MREPIRWDWVHQAITFYGGAGFHYVETPWIVSGNALNVTLPSTKNGFKLDHPHLDPGYLVGSAEQSFIQMIMDGTFDRRKACAAGPCFRDEDVDDLHLLSFFKVELIEIDPDVKSYNEMINIAKRFMEYIGGKTLKIVKTSEGMDLFLNDIEVGSYGIRTFQDVTWAYGTGLALPRFSQALKLSIK